MKLRCLTVLLISLFFWKPSEGGRESFAYRGYVKKDAGKFVVLTKPQGGGSICAMWEMEEKAKITLDGSEVSGGRIYNLENRPMHIKMMVKTPLSVHPPTSLGGGTIVSMELTTIDDQSVVNSVCSVDANVAKLAI